jgi:putative transcriptional regulator
MTSRAFDQIAAGLKEAIAVASGTAEPAFWHKTVDIDVKAIRKQTGLSQSNFATTFGFTLEQVRSWEQGRAKPLGGVRAYLTLIKQDHTRVDAWLKSIKHPVAA